MASMSDSTTPQTHTPPFPMSWSRPWSTGGFATCGAWSGTRIWGWRTPCDARRRRVGSPTTVFATKVRRRSRPRPTASSQVVRRPVLSIAGPGATNLLTGLWDAHVDRSPVLALTGQVDTQVLGPGAFQEVDLAAAFGKVAQWSQSVLQTSKHPELVNLGLKSAILNRGVSHLIFPDEVQTLDAPGRCARPDEPEGRVARRRDRPALELRGEGHHPPEERQAPGDHRRPRRRLSYGAGHRTSGKALLPGHHYIQGQGARSPTTTPWAAESWDAVEPPLPATS